MCVLNTTAKQITIMKTQNAPPSYTKILKMRLNSTIKIVIKYIKYEIIILQYKCLLLDREEAKLAKIIKIVNTKIEDNNKEKVIIARKLSSKDIILTLDLAKTKNYIVKKTS